MKPRVFVTRLLPDDVLHLIRENCEMRVWQGDLPPPREVLLSNVEEADGLLSLLTDRIDSELLGRARKLKVISNYAVGYDNIDLEAATERGILVGYTPDVLTETTADFAFALMMAAARRLVEAHEYVKAGKWKTWGPLTLLGQDVHEATLGIVGLGRIGLALARRAKGFNMDILYHSKRSNPDAERELGIKFCSLDDLLARSDFVSVNVNLSADNFHMIGRAQLEKMKKTAVLVNTSRGAVVDNNALFEALHNHQITAAALDVTDPEPLPLDHPLLKLNNIVLAPHIASASVLTRRKMAMIAAQNLIAGLKGESPPAVVNGAAVNLRKRT